MPESAIFYASLLLIGVFISSVSQVMLKKATFKTYPSKIKEYLNPTVIFAYFLYFFTTFLSVFAYKGIPLSLGPVLEATSYLYITFFGVIIFKEKLNLRKVIALCFIIAGIFVYSFS